MQCDEIQNTATFHKTTSDLKHAVFLWSFTKTIMKGKNKPLNEGKREPQQYCAILRIFQLVSVNRSQAVMESLSQLLHRLLQITEQPRGT